MALAREGLATAAIAAGLDAAIGAAGPYLRPGRVDWGRTALSGTITCSAPAHEWVVPFTFTSILFARHRGAWRIVAAGLESGPGAGEARVPDGVAEVRRVADPSRP